MAGDREGLKCVEFQQRRDGVFCHSAAIGRRTPRFPSCGGPKSSSGRTSRDGAARFPFRSRPRGRRSRSGSGRSSRRFLIGETVTYSELARRAGRPNAIRAAGAANGKNPISIVIPCHRVVGKDGSLTGYGGGLSKEGSAPRARGSPFGRCPHTLAARPLPRASWPRRAGAMNDGKGKSQKRWAVAALLLLMTVACDQATKHVAASSFIDVIPYTLVGGFVELFYSENPGAFLGLGADFHHSTRFWLFTVGVGGLLLVFSARLFQAKKPVELVGWSLVIGGGASNLIDRVVARRPGGGFPAHRHRRPPDGDLQRGGRRDRARASRASLPPPFGFAKRGRFGLQSPRTSEESFEMGEGSRDSGLESAF